MKFPEKSSPPLIDIGYGSGVPIRKLAEAVYTVVRFESQLIHDPTKLDGTPPKLLGSARLRAIGWTPRIDLETGIGLAIEAAKEQLDRHLTSFSQNSIFVA